MAKRLKKDFADYEGALAWMAAKVNDPYQDNERFSYLDDDDALEKYHQKYNAGCCGYFDECVIVGGKLATIGCNFGH